MSSAGTQNPDLGILRGIPFHHFADPFIFFMELDICADIGQSNSVVSRIDAFRSDLCIGGEIVFYSQT